MSKILIADDEQVIRDLFMRFLPRLGHEVRVVDDGQKALDELKQREYDLLIMDMKMPGLDGLALLEKLGALQKKPAVIVITGFATAETAKDIAQLKNVQYVTKPFNLDEMQKAIQKALG